MFQQLRTMLRKGDTLTLTVAIENDTQLRVNVFPKLFTLDGEAGEDRKALNTPLSIVATEAELDSPAFLETLAGFAGSTNALRHTLDEVQATHKAAADAAATKSKVLADGHKKAAPAAAKPKAKDEDADEDEKPAAPKAPASAEEATPSLI